MTDVKVNPPRLGPARRADYKEEEARLNAANPPAAYSNEAELFALHGLPAPGPARPAKRVAHRPVSGFSRTHDAACIFRYLCGRGLSGREATTAVTAMLGTSRSSVLKYQPRAVKPSSAPKYQTGVIELSSELDDQQQAAYAVARHWDAFIRRSWHSLTPKACDALRPIVAFKLLGRKPPRARRPGT